MGAEPGEAPSTTSSTTSGAGSGAAELDPRRLLVLHAVAQCGGIPSAARLLGHTPSAVSQQVRRLERETGVTLLARVGGRLELTDAGRALAEGGRRIGAALAQAAEDLAALDARAAGPVRIGISAWGMAEIALPAIRELARQQPHIRPLIIEADQTDGLEGLREGTLDVLMLSDDRQTAVALPPRVTARVMSEDEYKLVVPASWPVPRTPADLDGRAWIVAPPHAASGRAFARFAAEHGLEPSERHRARQPSAVQVLLAGGLGAAVLPAFVANRLRDAVVTEIPVTGRYLVRILLRGGPGGAPSPAVRAVNLALRQASVDATERYAELGVAQREPVISTRLLDPSEEASADRAAAG
jgi:DNA-binding transcriptional LysR family regulator